MSQIVDLSGTWNFQMGSQNRPTGPYPDTISLPGTTAYAQKGIKNEQAEEGCLTEDYPFEGNAWYSRSLCITDELLDKRCLLYLERTRITTLWLDNDCLGTQDSLCAPHIYDLSGRLTKGEHQLTLRVSNTAYPTKGGHMTSKDTQTNWNGVTGRVELQISPRNCLADILVYPNAAEKTVTVQAQLCGGQAGELMLSAESFNGGPVHTAPQRCTTVEPGTICVCYPLGTAAQCWSEYEPVLYRLKLRLTVGQSTDTQEVIFGLRDFKTENGKFTVNGRETFLRGKHEALLFPLTGFAPTSLQAWMDKLQISREYGINHYRFHTCCPPEAAFTAADLLGIYMEPELPFWGTMPGNDASAAEQAERVYLEKEGYRMLKAYGNHPSFVMMSLGNELWGSDEQMEKMLEGYHDYDSTRLYTQGSNNFQFCPKFLKHDDFFCGVRFSRDRLLRGSYGMCDAPLGHVQLGTPGTAWDYDEAILPEKAVAAQAARGTIQIQYGTGTKTVEAVGGAAELRPDIPVVSHEIGQYAVYPDFREIMKYTGPLKAKNFEIFRRRLEKSGLADCAEAYFYCSGKLAMACYREELEAAFRSRKLAGFQLLDLQDYSGQGTALVGVLNAFMESKGLISSDEWRSFCNDAVLLARFPKYIFSAGETFHAVLQLRCTRPQIPAQLRLEWKLYDDKMVLASGLLKAASVPGNFQELGEISCVLPDTAEMRTLRLCLTESGLALQKSYPLWVCPLRGLPQPPVTVPVFHAPTKELLKHLEMGGSALLFADNLPDNKSITGTYCADFWCYPMFRSISESMGKPIPVGTMGLLIDSEHPALRHFPSERYSTQPWCSIQNHSRAVILDGTPQMLRPIVQVIDNFERNHKLALLFECRVGAGRLLVAAFDQQAAEQTPEGQQLLYSLYRYAASSEFQPTVTLEPACLTNLWTNENA